MLNQTELTSLCLEAKAFDTIVKLKREGKIPHLKHLVSYDPLAEEKAKEAAEVDLVVLNYSDVI